MQKKQTPMEFSEQLIKGKIAEVIFSQMFKNGKRFTVIPFGYENSFPEIAQYGYLADDKNVFETIRNAPDFAFVSMDKKEVYLIEVKYRHSLKNKQTYEDAEKMQSHWKQVKLFIATQEGFFIDDCSDIVKSNGKISQLPLNWVKEKTQKEYLDLLNKFICESR